MKHLDRVEDGYLTPNEFVDLYDTCNKVLHVWNPFSPDVSHVNFGRTLPNGSSGFSGCWTYI